MKSATKMLLLAAVAAFAFGAAVNTAEAAKKKATKVCEPWSWCSHDCKGNSCEVKSCADGKWIPSVFGTHCGGTNCPPKCPR